MAASWRADPLGLRFGNNGARGDLFLSDDVPNDPLGEAVDQKVLVVGVEQSEPLRMVADDSADLPLDDLAPESRGAGSACAWSSDETPVSCRPLQASLYVMSIDEERAVATKNTAGLSARVVDPSRPRPGRSDHLRRHLDIAPDSL
jgi:hypothetical protein